MVSSLSFQGDVCDILDEAATSAAAEAEPESIQLASCPRAHASVQGLVERRFHPIHLRDFYSVINYLLLRLFLSSGRKGDSHPVSTREDKEITSLKRQVAELHRKNRERKAKYEEVSLPMYIIG